MTFNHWTKHNGIYYPAGAEVPVGDNKPIEKKEDKAFSMSKTKLTRLSTDELKKLGKEYGLDTTEMSGNAIKKYFVDKYNL